MPHLHSNPALTKNLCVSVCFPVSPHHLQRVLVCVLCSEVLQNFLVGTVVDAVAIDFQDDLARLKTRPRCLPACNVSTDAQR